MNHHCDPRSDAVLFLKEGKETVQLGGWVTNVRTAYKNLKSCGSTNGIMHLGSYEIEKLEVRMVVESLVFIYIF